ncbi:MAG: isocitrate lyase/phosphoenolpyruvate mutase family protein [Planctomycetaceae bacterium]|nr:isocitrate lyase/phosphoenolpyruvate mutase family protein [Planctomycetaceae bacterium]
MANISPGLKLRQAARAGTLAIPGAFNAAVGRLIEEAGFPAAYLAGAAFSAGVLALPDIGLFTLSELVEQVTLLTRRIAIPLIVDADTGFGEAVNVERTIIEHEAAGAAAIQHEDQPLPKRCGHLSGKNLVETADMCAKIRAAGAARRDTKQVILARTDARGVTTFADAVERARRYLDAGADWIFPEALANRGEFERFRREVDAPLVANMTEFGKSELLPLSFFRELGYGGVLFPVTLFRVAMKAVEQALARIAGDGTQQSLLGEMQTRQQLYDLLRYSDYEARDRAFFEGERTQ